MNGSVGGGPRGARGSGPAELAAAPIGPRGLESVNDIMTRFAETLPADSAAAIREGQIRAEFECAREDLQNAYRRAQRLWQLTDGDLYAIATCVSIADTIRLLDRVPLGAEPAPQCPLDCG